MGAQRPQRPPPGHSLLMPRVGDGSTQRALDSVKLTAQQMQKTAAATQTALDALHVTGTAPPTSGRHKIGDIVWNSAPVAGGFIGWVCVAEGNPGTWKAWGAIVP